MTDIVTDEGTILEALNNKVDLPNGGSQASTDYVVEWKTPTSADPTWYRVYKSGWVEQGGIVDTKSHPGSTTTSTTITLQKTMSDTSYYVMTNLLNGGNYYSYLVTSISTKTTSSFIIATYDNSGSAATSGYHWEVKGQGA